MSGYHRISHDFLLSLPRICIINQRLYIVYVRLATNLLQITVKRLKKQGNKVELLPENSEFKPIV
ncbi:S24 family peptidase, partial [Escherichia coli]